MAVAAPPERPYTPPRRRRRAWIPNLLLSVLLLVLLGGAAGGIVIAALIGELPNIRALDDPNTLGFKTARIFDRRGQPLWEINDPAGGKRTVVPLRDMSPHLVKATLAAEDARYYEHRGFDVTAIVRAIIIDLTRQGTTGASTITQQLVRNVLLDPTEARQTTARRKLREIALAYQVDQRYSKDQVLELYLNHVYYGNQSYGVEAAAQGYFGKPAHELSLAEASLLAGLVQSPSQYDPTRRDVERTADGMPVLTKERQRYVLEQMAQHSWITEDQARTAYDEKLSVRPRQLDIKAPHWVMYVRDQLEQEFGDRTLYSAGLRVYTTLDLDYNQRMRQVLRDHSDVIEQQGGNNAALIAVDPRTGEILAFQGSLDYDDASIDGQVNVLTSARQPGSSIKPVVYATSFLKGWAPGTPIDDVRSCWQDRPGRQWCPSNFDDKFHGQMTARTALGNSINIPAVKTLEFVGVQSAVDLGTRLGITTWGPDSGKTLGLSLTLGGAEVRPIDMAQVYATFANSGRKVPLVSIRQVSDASGKVLREHREVAGEQAIDPRAAYMLSNILSDPKAKLFTYGRNTPLNLKDRPAASKTGTTDNYRDTWTVGYTTNLALVVWVGNTDGRPMKQALSSMTAGKIWPLAMQESFTLLGLPAEDFPRPAGLTEQQVCGDTALRPGEPACRNDLFVEGLAPQVKPTTVATPQAKPTEPLEPTATPEQTRAAQPTAAPPDQKPTAAPVAPTPLPRQDPTQPPAPTAPPKPAPTAPSKPIR